VLKTGGRAVVPFTPDESSGQPQFVKMLRDAGQGERVASMGFISNAVFEGDNVRVTVTEPEGLLADESLRFEPPMIEHATNPAAFEFFWRILGFVLDVDDPRDFPPLNDPLGADDAVVVRRYIGVAKDLAQSMAVNQAQGFRVHLTSIEDIGQVEDWFSKKDAQIGLATLLRQCEEPKEPARFDRVYRILRDAVESTDDIAQHARLARIDSWARARKQLRHRSLNQLMRDGLVRQRGYEALRYREEHSPAYLLEAFNYGDLIHWGNKATVVSAWEVDPVQEQEQRLAFLDAATGLAHVHLGFGVLAEAAAGIEKPGVQPRR
jgi:hypothetical protein